MNDKYLAAHMRVRDVVVGGIAVKHITLDRIQVGRLEERHSGHWTAVRPDGLERTGDWHGWRAGAYWLMQTSGVEVSMPTTTAGWLRYVSAFLQHGVVVTPATVYLLMWGTHLTSTFYEARKGLTWREAGLAARDTIHQMVELQKRYKRFCRYVREEKPQWRVVHVTAYADNSTEATEVDKDGNRRQRMIDYPHGD